MSTSWTALLNQRASHRGRVGRYAPSPTGRLHLGNLRTALLSWLHARVTGSSYILRIEDIDEPRAIPGAAAQLIEDLRWLGLDWDEGPDIGGPSGPYVQSERKAIYQAAFEALASEGLLYPCLCSRRDIQAASSAPHGATPIYPGTCRGLTQAQLEQRAAKKQRAPTWRLAVPEQVYQIEDLCVGHYQQRLDQEVGDFVLKRMDGFFAYQLVVVVDDLLMGVTDVIRGEDLLDSAPRQVLLFERLGGEAPRFGHVPLMHDEQGAKLSKRDGSASLAQLKAEGQTPQQVLGYIVRSLGLEVERISLEELLQEVHDERGFLALC